MGNCKAGISQVCADYDAYWTRLFWDPVVPKGEKGWFLHTTRLLEQAFPQASSCMTVVPPFRPRRIDCAAVYDTEQLREQVLPTIRRIAEWTERMTDVAECMNDRLLEGVPEPVRKPIDDMLDEIRQVQSAVARFPNPPRMPPAPAASCALFLRWLRDFFKWGDKLSKWENALCLLLGNECRTRRDHPEGRQVAPPPWPPWKPFDDELPDSDAIDGLAADRPRGETF